MNNNELIIHPSATSRDTLIVGAIAGLTAGLAMALWGVLTSIWHGLDLLASFQMIGATFLGPDATEAGLGMTLYGVVLHAMTAAAFGILFTMFLPQNSTTKYASAAGLGFGMAILLAMTFVVTPIVNPVLRHTVASLPKSWVIQHALFGLTLGIVPTLWRMYHSDSIRVRWRDHGAVVVRRPNALPVPRAFVTPRTTRVLHRSAVRRAVRTPTPIGPQQAIS
ncbi:MAG TPA: hypothetical protein VJ717_03215 [Gemmatimonadaceae bacterium]|nr:hypothetical protein [Gemmatimonadaceae bacterium]